ncbi:GntR family transcriptional regulator [Niveispirillum sp. KHB5.9]|uniref:GntR family transcriptional regulator n=1 Tax=Niveispirillum sp. KHB5.9 TaxID=3400269 RepID=UPI003A84D630
MTDDEEKLRVQSDAHAGDPRFNRSPGFAEEIFKIIRADIMSLAIPPDTRISIDGLAKKLGVSQTPIREALSMLEAIGLVTKRHFAGYCSAPQLNRKQFEHLFETRLLIEPYAAKCAANRMDDRAMAKLIDLARGMTAADSRETYDKFADQDSQLHDLIATGSGNPIIRDALARLNTHFHIFRLRFHSGVATEAVNEHAVLIEALSARDPEAAEAAMREHLQRSYDRFAPFSDN